MKLHTRNTIFRILYILLGSFLYSISINALFIPHQLLNGGMTGIAMMLQYLFRIPTSISIVVLNIPLFFGSNRFIGKRFTYLSILGILFSSLFLFLTRGWVIDVENSIVAAIFGGLIAGIGSGINQKPRSLAARISSPSLSTSTFPSESAVGMAINAIILTVAAFLFNVEMAMLTIVAIFVATRAVDADTRRGFNHRKPVCHRFDKYEEIGRELLKKVERGELLLLWRRSYTGTEKKRFIRLSHHGSSPEPGYRKKNRSGCLPFHYRYPKYEGKGFHINGILRKELANMNFKSIHR